MSHKRIIALSIICGLIFSYVFATLHIPLWFHAIGWVFAFVHTYATFWREN